MKRVLPYLMMAFLLGMIQDVSAQCDARFSYYTQGSGAFTFVDSTGATYDKEIWTFGDGSVDSVLQRGTISHKYNAAGSYTVCRAVWDSAKGCRDTFCMKIKWTNNCKASFTYSIKGDTVTFTNTSPSGILSSWSFGDGSNSYTRNPTHIYNSSTGARTFSACLSTWDSARSCFDKTCQTFTLKGSGGGSGAGCSAVFKVTNQNNYHYFNTNSVNRSAIYTWTFGDGSGYTAVGTGYASHKYKSVTTPTSMAVCLYVYDSASNCKDSFCDKVYLYPDTCGASFYARPSGRGVVSFTNTSKGGTSATSYSWTFGDGGRSAQYSPTHTYASAGYYYVCLSMYDSIKKCSSQFCDTIWSDTSNTTGGGCRADFSFGVQGSMVYFKNASSTSGQYSWSFGDGSTSTSFSPSHTYSSAGTYTVCLILTTSTCSDTVCKTVQVSRTSGCKAQYRVWVDTTRGKQFKLWLINTSSNAASHTYYWTFGDGTSSTQRNPKHKYSKFGKYEICLTVSDTVQNCSDRYCDSIGMDSTGRVYKAEGFEVEVTDDLLSTKDISNVEYKLYPNPSEGLFNIELASFRNGAYVKVMSLDGRMVVEKNIDKYGASVLDLTAQNDGVYIVQIFDGTSYSQTKLVKMSN